MRQVFVYPYGSRMTRKSVNVKVFSMSHMDRMCYCSNMNGKYSCNKSKEFLICTRLLHWFHVDVMTWKRFPYYWPVVSWTLPTSKSPPPPQRASKAKLWYFLWSQIEQALKQTVKLLRSWDIITLIRRHCDVFRHECLYIDIKTHIQSSKNMFNLQWPSLYHDCHDFNLHVYIYCMLTYISTTHILHLNIHNTI